MPQIATVRDDHNWKCSRAAPGPDSAAAPSDRADPGRGAGAGGAASARGRRRSRTRPGGSDGLERGTATAATPAKAAAWQEAGASVSMEASCGRVSCAARRGIFVRGVERVLGRPPALCPRRRRAAAARWTPAAVRPAAPRGGGRGVPRAPSPLPPRAPGPSCGGWKARRALSVVTKRATEVYGRTPVCRRIVVPSSYSEM